MPPHGAQTRHPTPVLIPGKLVEMFVHRIEIERSSYSNQQDLRDNSHVVRNQHQETPDLPNLKSGLL
jgi:hypothetical protein